jgi:hypothetical protein
MLTDKLLAERREKHCHHTLMRNVNRNFGLYRFKEKR